MLRSAAKEKAISPTWPQFVQKSSGPCSRLLPLYSHMKIYAVIYIYIIYIYIYIYIFIYIYIYTYIYIYMVAPPPWTNLRHETDLVCTCVAAN